jgi:hypothetical protein
MKVVRIEERAAQCGRRGIETGPTSGERARLLMREARSAAVEHPETLEAAIQAVRGLSLEVVQGGDTYSVGVRDLAARLAEDLLWRGKSLEGLTARERAGLLAH